MLATIPLCLVFLSVGQEEGQGRRPPPQPTPTPIIIMNPVPNASPVAASSGQARAPQERPSPSPEEPPVVTHHEIRAGGKTLRYTATVGMMPIKNRDGETEARIFFMAYTLDEGGNRGRRPLNFSFNGGAGWGSVWLHLGAIGPKRGPMNPDGTMLSPAYPLVVNGS